MEPDASDDVKREKRKKKFEELDDKILSSMGAAIISASERAMEDLNVGELKRIIIESEEGIILLSKEGNKVKINTAPKNSSKA